MSTGFAESVAFTVTVEVPAVVGVPLTVQPVSVRPAGNVPLVIVQAYGETPPLTLIGAEYGTFTVPSGSVDVVSVSGAGAMVIVSGPVVVSTGFAESVAFTVTVDAPAVVGVPLTTQPVSFKPAGSVPFVIAQE